MLSTSSKIAIGLAVPVGVYAVVLGALMTPYLQRFSLYAHKINTLFYHNINNAEQFGFAKNQVTPFHIRTPDGETLYAWHVLPLDTYLRNEEALEAQPRPHGPVEDFTTTLPFHLLTSTSSPRVVVNFHGNAGHIAQGWRTDTYHRLSTQPNTHVLTVDYRGFGYSTGSPTEEGLITDGVALVEWVLRVAKIPPGRIVILGQSLGTAVAAAVGLRFVDAGSALLLPPLSAVSKGEGGEAEGALLAHTSDDHDGVMETPTAFAGLILVAPFSSLPSLMLTYRIAGYLPLLLPLRPFPFLAKMLTGRMVDQWPTADRLRAYYDAFASTPDLLHAGMGGLHLIHATNDGDIDFHQTQMICQRVLGSERSEHEECEVGKGGLVDVKREGRPRVRVEVLEFGGHNRIVTYSAVSLAVLRAFGDGDD